MSADEILDRSLAAITLAVREREVTALELVEAALARIDARDDVNAVVVRDDARSLDAAASGRAAGGALAGVPLLVKESEDVAGLRTTLGDPGRADMAAAGTDSSLVARLRAAGAIVVGKTNIPPYVLTAEASNPIFGRTVNPHNPARGPGGSSGGAAAALARGLTPLATGSDGGGSIRIPSSACGLPGFKPTSGVVAIGDADPYVWSGIDTRSIMARTVDDIAFALDVVAGPSRRDPYSVDVRGGFTAAVAAGADPATLQDLRAAWSPDLGYGTTDPGVLAVCERAVARLSAAGVAVSGIDHLLAADPVDIWLKLVLPETARRALAVGPDIERLGDPLFGVSIEMGRAYTGVQVAQAESERRRILAALAAVFDHHAVLLSPTVMGPPPPVDGGGGSNWVGYTYVANLATVPAATVPVGWVDVDAGPPVPVGLQVCGPRLHDRNVLAVAAALTTVVEFDPRPPDDRQARI